MALCLAYKRVYGKTMWIYDIKLIVGYFRYCFLFLYTCKHIKIHIIKTKLKDDTFPFFFKQTFFSILHKKNLKKNILTENRYLYGCPLSKRLTNKHIWHKVGTELKFKLFKIFKLISY